MCVIFLYETKTQEAFKFSETLKKKSFLIYKNKAFAIGISQSRSKIDLPKKNPQKISAKFDLKSYTYSYTRDCRRNLTLDPRPERSVSSPVKLSNSFSSTTTSCQEVTTKP